MGAIFWAISTVIFAVLEIIIPGLVTIWLALSALIVTILTLFITNVTMEFLIFSILSLVFLFFTRPILSKYIDKKNLKFNSQMIGTNVQIEKIVENDKLNKIYEVKFKGSYWTGISEENYEIGEIVKIKKFEGNKIILEK